MSIYPVRLAEWYGPRGSISWRKTKDKEESEDRKRKWETIISIASGSKCCRCGKKPKATTMIADHSLPWGYYGEVWCSSRCYRRKLRTRQFEKDRIEAEELEKYKKREGIKEELTIEINKMYPSSLYGKFNELREISS